MTMIGTDGITLIVVILAVVCALFIAVEPTRK